MVRGAKVEENPKGQGTILRCDQCGSTFPDMEQFREHLQECKIDLEQTERDKQ